MYRFRAPTAVAVTVVVLVGCQPGASSSSEPGSERPASVAPSEEPTSAEPSAEAFLPEGPFVWFDPAAPTDPEFDDGPPIVVTIPASGWISGTFLYKGEEVENLPESAFLLTSTTHGILVYGDPCRWIAPDTPATTAEEVVAALGAQASRDASDPVDVTIGGYAAKRITLHVPEDAAYNGEDFTDCAGGKFATYTLDGYSGPWRWQQGPGQIDTYWVVDVDGAIVIINGMYRPDTSAERIEEMRILAESATFELP